MGLDGEIGGVSEESKRGEWEGMAEVGGRGGVGEVNLRGRARKGDGEKFGSFLSSVSLRFLDRC